MCKTKSASTAKLVSEALSGADEAKGMKARQILKSINKKQPVQDKKEVLNQIHRELERGKQFGEYLQVRGTSIHGTFKLNPDYVPSDEDRPKSPDFAFPPEVVKHEERIDLAAIVAHECISIHVAKLKSPDLCVKKQGLQSLFIFMTRSKIERRIIVELGAIPHFVEFLQLDDDEALYYAAFYVQQLCEDAPRNCVQLIQSGIGGKLLNLVKDEKFCSTDLLTQKMAALTILHIVQRFHENKCSISTDQLSELVQTLMVLLDVDDYEIIASASRALSLSCTSRNLSSNFLLQEKQIARIIFVIRNGSHEIKKNLLYFVSCLMRGNVANISTILNADLLGLLLNCLYDEELANKALECLGVALVYGEVDFEWLFNAGTVPKLIRFLGSTNKRRARLATECLLIFVKVIDVNLLARQFNSDTFMRLTESVAYFETFGRGKDVSKQFHELREAIDHQTQFFWPSLTNITAIHQWFTSGLPHIFY